MTHGPLGNDDVPTRRGQGRDVPTQVTPIELSIVGDGMSQVLVDSTRSHLVRELNHRVTVVHERQTMYVAILRTSSSRYEAHGPYTSKLELNSQHPNADYVVEGYQW